MIIKENVKTMKTKTSDRLLEKGKKISIYEGSSSSVMDGFGTRYVTPFANAMGISNKYIGFLTSMPSLLGNLIQLISPRLMERFSRKKIVFLGVLLQSFMWLVLLTLGISFFVFNLNKEITSVLLVAIYTILSLFGAFAGPAWNSWMKDLVHGKDRGKYFGNRNRIAGSVSLICMLIAGFILDYFKSTKIFIAFIILFSLAFIGRFMSAMFFKKQYEPKLKLEKGYYFSFWQFIKRMQYNNFGRFTIFIALLNLGTAIASPFFVIYWLNNLHLNSIEFGYILFTLISMIAPVATLLIMSKWGKFSDKYGNLKAMRICGIFLPLIPLAFLLSSFMIGHIALSGIILFFIFEEAISGLAWAGFNLASSNFIYDAVTRERMGICVAYFNIVNGIGIFIGATIGGFISSANFNFFGLNPLLFVFLASAIARFFVIIFMLPKIKEVREVEQFGIEQVKNKILRMSPRKIFDTLNPSTPVPD